MIDTHETTESKAPPKDAIHPEATSGVPSVPPEPDPEFELLAPGKRLPRGAWRWYVGAAALVLAGLLCLNQFMPSEPSQPNSTRPTGESIPLPDDVRVEEVRRISMPSEPSQPHSTYSSGKSIPLPDDVCLKEGRNIYVYTPENAKEEQHYKDSIKRMVESGDYVQTLEDAYAQGIPLADDGSIATDRFFILTPELYSKLVENNVLFAESKRDKLRRLSVFNVPVMIYKPKQGWGLKVIVGYMDNDTHQLYPAVYRNRGVVFADAVISRLVVDSSLEKRINEIKTGLEELRKSVDQLDKAQVIPHTTPSTSAVEMARTLEKAGNHEKAGYCWRNAEPVAKQIADKVEVIQEDVAGEIDDDLPVPNFQPDTVPSGEPPPAGLTEIERNPR